MVEESIGDVERNRGQIALLTHALEHLERLAQDLLAALGVADDEVAESVGDGRPGPAQGQAEITVDVARFLDLAHSIGATREGIEPAAPVQLVSDRDALLRIGQHPFALRKRFVNRHGPEELSPRKPEERFTLGAEVTRSPCGFERLLRGGLHRTVLGDQQMRVDDQAPCATERDVVSALLEGR